MDATGGSLTPLRWVAPLTPGAEDRKPFREVAGLWRESQPFQGGWHAFGRARHTKLNAQPPPEFGLPGTVGGKRRSPGVDVVAVGPTADHGRSGGGVPGEKACQMPRGRPAPSGTEWIQLGRPSVATEVVPQQCRPRLSTAGVDHSKQRPHCAMRLPRISVLLVRAAGEGTRHKSPR